MKTIYLFGVLLAVSTLQAQTLTQDPANNVNLPSPTPYSVVSRDGNSALWQQQTYQQGPKGTIVTNTHQYTEIGTGLNHLVNGQYVPSAEDIEISPDGSSASATNGQHQVYFPGDIYNGEIKLVTPDGQTLESQPIGLAYFDGTNSVLVATVTNSTGAILPSGNQVIYSNAFAGLNADLFYTYTKAGMEQNVVLRQQPPDPLSLGLNPATTRLQVLTEFIRSPQPSVTPNTVATEAGNLEDDTLSFGTMQMGQGQAFLMGINSPSVPVDKQWMTIQGRQFLIEEVPIFAIATAINTLPQHVAQANPGAKPVVSKALHLPPQRLTHASPKGTFLAKAKAVAPNWGLVLDYQTVNSSLTNWTFQGDTTYYVSGPLSLLSGTDTFEGGTTLKYATNAKVTINIAAINWLAGPYRPVVMTAKDDNSVGETISGSNGNPTNNYANPALVIISTGVSRPISNFRIAFATQAVSLISSSSYYFYDGQIVNCQNGYYAQSSAHCYLRNVLFSGVLTNFSNLQTTIFDVQNATFNSSAYLATMASLGYQVAKLNFTNCIFANVTNLTNNASAYLLLFQILGCTNGFYNCPTFGSGQLTNNASPFQSVGAGNYYLTNGCVFTNAGTTNIDPTLLADLQTRTTFPPALVYSCPNDQIMRLI
jgi:hypothetical protein